MKFAKTFAELGIHFTELEETFAELGQNDVLSVRVNRFCAYVFVPTFGLNRFGAYCRVTTLL